MVRFLPCVLLLTALLISCGKNESAETGTIAIHWTDSVPGDFTFTESWDYPEGVYKNEFGQVICDGFCPPEIDDMMDSAGRIFPDSLDAFYALVDTTHYYHTIESDARTYAWAGTDYVTATRVSRDTVVCETHLNVGTHSNLRLLLVNDRCIPVIRLISVVAGGDQTYRCKNGTLDVDKTLWAKGILKARFALTFHDSEDPGQPMYWNGRIYAEIESMESMP